MHAMDSIQYIGLRGELARLDGLGWIMLTGGGRTISSNWSGSVNINEDGIHLNLLVGQHKNKVS